jgi:hypothetical protein
MNGDGFDAHFAVLMPISRQARKMRSAISPRLAMTILSSIADLPDHSVVR